MVKRERYEVGIFGRFVFTLKNERVWYIWRMGAELAELTKQRQSI